MNSSSKTTKMCLCALFTALIIVGAFIKIPVPVVPFTLQYLFTMLAGILLGKKYGSLSVALYVLLGLAGLPVFAQGGGISYIFMPSFGYLPGFIAGTYLTGLITHKKENPSFRRILTANIAGLIIVYLCGMVYCYMAKNIWTEGEGIGIWPLILNCFILAVPGDILLCFAGAALGRRLIPVTEKYRQ